MRGILIQLNQGMPRKNLLPRKTIMKASVLAGLLNTANYIANENK